jgi:hypothetical protein
MKALQDQLVRLHKAWLHNPDVRTDILPKLYDVLDDLEVARGSRTPYEQSILRELEQ